MYLVEAFGKNQFGKNPKHMIIGTGVWNMIIDNQKKTTMTGGVCKHGQYKGAFCTCNIFAHIYWLLSTSVFTFKFISEINIYQEIYIIIINRNEY